jgi:hypothetical protein
MSTIVITEQSTIQTVSVQTAGPKGDKGDFPTSGSFSFSGSFGVTGSLSLNGNNILNDTVFYQ